MRPTLTKKIGLLLLLPFVGSLAGVLVFASYVTRARPYPHFLSVAGRQTAVAAELRESVHMVALGQEENRAGLRSRVEEFEHALVVLRRGGRIARRGTSTPAPSERQPELQCQPCHTRSGVDIVPAPPELQPELAAVASLWNELRPNLLTVADAPRDEARFVEAYRRLEDRLPELRDLSQQVVMALAATYRREHDRMSWTLSVVVAVACAVFLAGLVLTRRYVVRPVLGVENAARHIRAGDFSVRLDAGARDELGTLARTFNEMAEQVERLLGALDLCRKHAETIIASVPASLLVLRDDLTVLRTNRSFREAFGLDEREVAGKGLGDLLPAPGLREAALEVLSSGEAKRGHYFEIPWKDGKRSLRVTIAGTRLAEEEEEEEEEEGKLLVVVENLTWEEQLAARARVSQRRFEEVIQHATDGMVFIDHHGHIVQFNRAAAKLFGWSREELLGKPLTMLMPEKYRAAHEQGLARYLATRESQVLGRVLSLEALRKDGSVFPIELAVSVYREDGEVVFLGVLRDVTEQTALTARLMQMDRMVAVGTLAAGVAHEINNPLAYVITNLELLARDLPALLAAVRGAELRRLVSNGAEHASPGLSGQDLSELEQALAEAREGAERVRKVVRDLRVFSRADEEERREPVSLPRVLDSAASMAWNELRHRARLVKDFGPTPLVEANESRLGQVFLNLLVNAAHAIPEGHVEANEIRIVTRTDERGQVIVEVRDTGCGIPSDVLPRIFDPFFTTKPVGHGSGLGLSICRRIVTEFAGAIDVESEVGKGTVLRVTLPPARLEALPAAPPEQPAVQPGRRGRILIIDDEPMVGTALRRILEREHDVVAVTSGREALERLAGEQFDLMLCDLMMPEMTGMDFYAEVGRRFPDQAQRVIFMTGGAFTPRAREFLDRVPNQRLEKPVDARNMRALIRDLLR